MQHRRPVNEDRVFVALKDIFFSARLSHCLRLLGGEGGGLVCESVGKADLCQIVLTEKVVNGIC